MFEFSPHLKGHRLETPLPGFYLEIWFLYTWKRFMRPVCVDQPDFKAHCFSKTRGNISLWWGPFGGSGELLRLVEKIGLD